MKRTGGRSSPAPRCLERGWPHPEHAFLPVATALIIMVGWAGIAHESGVGWVQALGALIAAIFVIGLLWPAWPVSRARVLELRCPPDAVARQPFTCHVATDRVVQVRPLDLDGAAVTAGPDGTQLILTPSRRSILTTARFEIASAAPFGLLWWVRQVTLRLAIPVAVAPAVGTPAPFPASGGTEEGTAGRPTPRAGVEVMAILPYRPGDRWRDVHWPASAHSGELLTATRSSPRSAPTTLLVELPMPSLSTGTGGKSEPADADGQTSEPDTEAETVASNALATALSLLANGTPVVLGTLEEQGPVVAPVYDRLSAGRRLAGAISGKWIDTAEPGAERAR